MAHLLQIDSSVQGEQSVSRALTARDPQMAELKPLAAESLAAAEREIEAQWAPVTVA